MTQKKAGNVNLNTSFHKFPVSNKFLCIHSKITGSILPVYLMCAYPTPTADVFKSPKQGHPDLSNDITPKLAEIDRDGSLDGLRAVLEVSNDSSSLEQLGKINKNIEVEYLRKLNRCAKSKDTKLHYLIIAISGAKQHVQRRATESDTEMKLRTTWKASSTHTLFFEKDANFAFHASQQQWPPQIGKRKFSTIGQTALSIASCSPIQNI